MSEQNHEAANALASDLAEDYLVSNMVDVYIHSHDAEVRARSIRQLSESNADQLHPAVQEYRAAHRAMATAIYRLIQGYKGYRLIATDGNSL